MPFYLETFTCVNIDTFPAIYIDKFESSQSFDFYSLLVFQGLFNQEKKLFYEHLGILLGHAMFSSQQVSKVLNC